VKVAPEPPERGTTNEKLLLGRLRGLRGFA